VGGSSYTSDANGNLLSGGGRSVTWDGANRPLTVTSGGVTETCSDDGDGTRVTRTRGGVMTVDLGGALEQAGGVQTRYYRFNGQVIAQRSLSGTCYLHGDHLGSVSLVTNGPSGGALVSQQEFDPWGKVRSGGVGQTSRYGRRAASPQRPAAGRDGAAVVGSFCQSGNGRGRLSGRADDHGGCHEPLRLER
jgi:hypothetical protein